MLVLRDREFQTKTAGVLPVQYTTVRAPSCVQVEIEGETPNGIFYNNVFVFVGLPSTTIITHGSSTGTEYRWMDPPPRSSVWLPCFRPVFPFIFSKAYNTRVFSAMPTIGVEVEGEPGNKRMGTY